MCIQAINPGESVYQELIGVYVVLKSTRLFTITYGGFLDGGVSACADGLHAVGGCGGLRQHHRKFVDVLLCSRTDCREQGAVHVDVETGLIAGGIRPGEGGGLLEAREEVFGLGQCDALPCNVQVGRRGREEDERDNGNKYNAGIRVA